MKSLLQKPKWRTLLFVSFVLLFYFTRTRPSDPIGDLKFDGELGFMAVGKAGVTVLGISDPENLVTISEFDTLGYSHAVFVQGKRVFVADDSNGLLILSKEKLIKGDKEETQLANFKTPGKAIDVAVEGNFAYVVDSKGDIWIVNFNKFLSNPTGENGTKVEVDGKAERIQIHENRAYISTNKDQFLIFKLEDPQVFENPGIYNVGAPIQNFSIEGVDRAFIAADSKGLVVLDISKPDEIILEKVYGDVRDALDVFQQGNYAYVASGNKGFYVLDITDSSAITRVGHEPSPADAHLIRVVDNYVFIADDRDGLKTYESSVLFEYSEKEESTNLGSFEAVIVKDDYSYVAAGEDGLRIINVNDPNTPIGIYFDDKVDGFASAIDSQEDYLYVLYRKKGLRIYSVIESSDNPKLDNEKDTPGEANGLMVKDEFVYIADGPMGLQIVDLQDYTNPKIYSEDTPGNALDVFVLDDYAYIADGEEGLQIILVSDPENPTLVNKVDTPGESTNVFVSKIKNTAEEERTYVFIADGGAGLKIVDVTDPNQPVDVATYATKNFANDVIVKDATVYLAERDDGLMLLDISKITEPVLIGNQPTPGTALGINIQEKFGYIADGNRGLRVISIEDREKIQEIGFFDVPKNAIAIIANETNGYMVDGDEGMWVMDLSTPDSPYPAAFYTTPGKANSIKVEADNAFIADGSSGLQVVDIIKPFTPVKAGSFEEIENAITVAVDGDFSYVGSADNKLHILNISDLTKITKVSDYEIKAEPKEIEVHAGYVYIAQGEYGLEIINIENTEDPNSVFVNQDLGLLDTQSLFVLKNRDHLFVADGNNGLKVLDISKPAKPVEVFHFPIQSENGRARSVTIQDEYAFLAVENESIYQFHILDLENISIVGTTPIEEAQSIAAILSSPGDKPIKRFYNYVAVGKQGLKTFEVSGEAGIQIIGFYETGGEATLSQVFRSVSTSLITSLSENPIPIPDKVWIRIGYMVFGVIVFISVSVLWLFLFAQFVLPVQTFKEGVKASRRLWVSLWGNHGPAVFAKDGILVARSNELDRRGKGVVRVDLNSAIVVERRSMMQPGWRRYYKKYIERETRRGNPLPRSRVEGPGIVFIRPYETIRGVADLRSQFRIRPGVQAYTRDGIEVNNPVWILFTLGQPPVTLDVTYHGDRIPENLRVVSFKNTLLASGNGGEHRGVFIDQITDELDFSDKEEIHLFVQKNLLAKYFQKIKKNANQIDLTGESREIIDHFVENLRILATRFDIEGREKVKDFFAEVDTIVELCLKDDILDSSSLKWFGYHVSVLADQFTLEGMSAFHEYLYRLKFDRYNSELRELQFPKEWVEYANQRVAQFNNRIKGYDRNKEFILISLRVLIIINREINREIEALSDDDLDQIKRDELEMFLKKFSLITNEFIRTDYPFSENYSYVAKIYDCTHEMNQVASEITILEEWRFPNLVDRIRIRKSIGNLQNMIADKEIACKAEFERYIDFVQIYDFVEYLRLQIDKLRIPRLEENSYELNLLIDQINLKLRNLNFKKDSAYCRQVEKIVKLSHGLDGDDSSKVYFYFKKVDEILQKIRLADDFAVRSFLRKSKTQISQIRREINKLGSLMMSGMVNGEVQQYQIQISEIKLQIKKCEVPDRLFYKNHPKQTNIGPYIFDRKRVLAAVYSEALDLDRFEGEEKHMHWTKLPVHVAAQTFRDMVSREQYDYLYQPNDPYKFNMPILKGNFSRSVRNKGVLAFRFVDHNDGLPLSEGDELESDQLHYYEKRELKNPKVLRSRGIKVIASGFPDLFTVSEGVPAHQLDYWSAPWQKASTEIRSQHQLQAVRVINQSRAQAQRDMAYSLARILQSSRSEEALAMRVFQALEATAADNDIRRFLPRDTMYLLRNFRQWFLESDENEVDNPPLPFNESDRDE